MKALTVLLLLAGFVAAQTVGIEPVTETGTDGVTRTWYRINTANGPLYDRPVEQPESPALRSDTGVLWVDRNHRYGICQSTAVSGDGRHILANWYLNSPRADYYRTLGTEVPVWESPGDFSWAYGGQQLGVSRDAGTMTLSSVTAASKWSSTSPYPDWVYPYAAPATGFSRCSRNGNRVVVCQNGVLTGIRASNGHVQWTASVPEPDRLQGIDLSDNGQIVAVTLYDSCIVFDQGIRRAGIPIGATNCGTQYAAALSGDGSMLVTGDYFGYLKLYSWDSTAQTYDLQWQTQVGTPWVAGVSISRDGSTIACGTGYANGKLCVFDSSSSAPVMVYQNYGSTGAYVASVALSDSGERVAAASWGDIATSGDFRVFTVHNVGDTTPLVAVTRNEEPGSLFACDISGDGQFACAGGKAVHANVMGNGGEVYAVLIGATDSVNVGASAVLEPGRYLQVGNAVTPRGEVRNYGDVTVSVPVHFVIRRDNDSIVYEDSAVAADLAPGAASPVAFGQWTPDTFSLYDCRIFTALPGDSYAADDTLAIAAKCFHDGRPIWIRPPNAEQTINMVFSPKVGVHNNGSYTDAMSLELTLLDSAGTAVYTQSLSAGTIAEDDTVTVTLPALAIGNPGTYTAMAVVTCTDDCHPENDTLRIQFTVTYEIIYDDGGAEAYYWVGRVDNDKFYARLRPTLTPPFRLTGGRVYVNMANTPFDYCMVCKDGAGRPDTLSPIQTVYDVRAPQAPGWAEFDLDVTVEDSSDLWLIAHWPDGSPAMGVGADATPPIDLRSYFSSNQDTFRLWTTHDWMMRLTQSPEVGVEEGAPAARRELRLLPSAPNPFADAVRLTYEVPYRTDVSLVLFDAAGRVIATLAQGVHAPGRHQVTWRPSAGTEVGAGVLFARLAAPACGPPRVTKLILAR